MEKQKLAEKILDCFKKRPQLLKNATKIMHSLALTVGLFYLIKQSIRKPKSYLAKTKNTNPLDLKAVNKKVETYLKLIHKHTDSTGFVLYYECDALLFTGLVGCDKRLPVYLEAARDRNGRWTRRPVDSDGCQTCYPKHSKSTISRDMYAGLLWYIWTHKRLDLAEQLYQKGQKDGWIMGEGSPGRIVFSPGLRKILAEIIYRLGGNNRPISRSIPLIFSKNIGYAAHLEILTAGLIAEVRGGATKKELDIIKHHAIRQKENALYRFFYSKYFADNHNLTCQLLLNTQYFPEKRLPGRKDRKEFWLWQRDQDDSGWQPDPKPEQHPHPTHAGADFLFVAHLINSDK